VNNFVSAGALGTWIFITPDFCTFQPLTFVRSNPSTCFVSTPFVRSNPSPEGAISRTKGTFLRSNPSRHPLLCVPTPPREGLLYVATPAAVLLATFPTFHSPPLWGFYEFALVVIAGNFGGECK